MFVASLAVLPLWGWLRRMFDDRLAALACLVYAFHGKLIAISPLIIRDPTFWFLMALTFYCIWRAVGEVRIGFFLAAGIALTLAIHTRTEGWLLVIPLLGWGACRWSDRDRGERLRLVVGTLLCIAAIPAAIAAVNLTWLRDDPPLGICARPICKRPSIGGIRKPGCIRPFPRRHHDPAAQPGHGSHSAIGCRSVRYRDTGRRRAAVFLSSLCRQPYRPSKLRLSGS